MSVFTSFCKQQKCFCIYMNTVWAYICAYVYENECELEFCYEEMILVYNFLVVLIILIIFSSAQLYNHSCSTFLPITN